MRRSAVLLVTLLAVIAMLLAAGCSSEESPTPTPTLEPTPVVTPQPTVAPTSAATPTPEPTPMPSLVPGNRMPNRFYGQAKLDGLPVPDGTVITAIVDGIEYEATTPAEGYDTSWYAVLVVEPQGRNYSGKTVTFRIEDHEADQTATWDVGANTKLNLTASTAP